MASSSPTLIRDPWRRLWHFLTSDGVLAAVLIFCGAQLLIAALLPQTPANDLVAYSRWLSEAQTRFGNLFEVLNALRLFSITASLPFRLALAALGWCAALRLIDQLDQLRQATRDRAARRSHVAAIMVYTGALLTLLGLVLGVFIDYRVDNIVVRPGGLTNIAGTPYAVRLATVEGQQAKVALLRQTETVALGSIGEKQALRDGVAIYLDEIGPALKVSAMRSATQTLNLQDAATSRLQEQALLLFTPDQDEGFLAAPEANLVLRVQPIAADRFAAQIYQSATGKDFGSRQFEPGGSISIEGVTFAFEPAAYVIVSLANQPSHWIVAPGLLFALIGLLGLLIWPGTAATTRLERAALVIERVSWPLITLLFVGLLIDVYPRTASLGIGDPLAALEVSLATWLLASGGVVTHKSARMVLAVLATSSALLAVWLLIAARA